MVTKREWIGVAVYAFVLLAMTTFPYVLAANANTDGWLFNGFLFGVEDGNAYLGKTLLGTDGQWSFHLFYTPDANEKAYLIYVPYLTMGNLIRLLIQEDDLSTRFAALIIGFHILRLIFGALLIATTYRFIAHFVRDTSARLTALVLSTLGGGLGWLLAILGYGEWLGSSPPDIYIPEGFGFLVIFGLPHIALARAFLLMGFLCLFRAVRLPMAHAWLWSMMGGLCWLIVGLGVAFYLVIIYCVVVAWGLTIWVKRRQLPWHLIWRVTIAVSITLPMFVYFVIVFTVNDSFAGWSAQNQLSAPHPLQYLLAYIFFAPAIWGGWWLWSHRSQMDNLLLCGWVGAVPILVYLPINVQRRLAEAVIVPLSVLCVIGLQLVVKRWPRRAHRRQWRRWRRLLLVSTSMTSVLLLVASTVNVLSPARPVYRPRAEIAAMDWLARHAEGDSIVFAARTTGNVLAVRTGLQVYIGHGPETLDSDHKQDIVEAFFSGMMTGDEVGQLLHTDDIDYVFYGETERDWAATDSPMWANTLLEVYNRDGYIIYEVLP